MLGITEDEVFKKADIASIQLSAAIEMFISTNFILTITLASPVEEILAGHVKSAKGKPAIEASIDQIEKVREVTGLQVAQGKRKRKIIKEWNHIKNRLKHQDLKESESIKFNAYVETYLLIIRALTNAKMLDIRIGNADDFDSCVISRVCL
jgi:hypothetical protein